MMYSFDSFFNQLTLVNYPPGYLGSFIINFLGCETEAYEKISKVHGQIGLQPNDEWAIVDYFVGGDRIKNHDLILEKLKLEYNDPEKALLYLISLLTHKSFVRKGKIVPYFANVFDDLYTDKLIPLSKEKVDNILFPYVKAHPYQSKVNVVDRSMFGVSLPWKDKIYCTFPEDKKWIPALLILHKHKFRHTKENLSNIVDSSYNQDNHPGYKILNTYDIIFKQDLTTLYNIYPDFELTEKRKELLDIATKVNNDILNKFDLTHTISYNTNIVAKESINAIYFNKK